MTTKTERILSYLPGTFKVSGNRSPLKAVVGTFGSELLKAENSLAALMRAHWVDHADKGAVNIDDLASMAALYGLAPETLLAGQTQDVEEFRTLLKQYVKTALQGSVTVQGILRTAANNLGLQIVDNYKSNDASVDDQIGIDTWWTRATDNLISQRHCGNDAAYVLFGKETLTSMGQAQTAARIVGQVNLDEPLDLTAAGVFNSRTLRIKINGKAKVNIDLLTSANDPTAVTSLEILEAINNAFAAPLARLENGVLVLTALTSGASSSILIEEHANDAAPVVLGLSPQSAKGQAATSASYTSKVDLSSSNDLSQIRYLRLKLDANEQAEIDCAGPTPAATTIAQITSAINAALGVSIASHDGSFLTLTSTLVGVGSSIKFLTAAAQDAVNLLLGSPPSAVVGHDKLAATITGTSDIKKGVDLTNHYVLRIRVNTASAVNVDCRGADPASSQLPEIVNMINDTLGKNVASHTGRHLILSSTTKGVTSKLSIETVEQNDGAEILLGIRPHNAMGTNASAAKITSAIDLSAGINLLASYQLRMQVDQADAVDINLAAGVADPKQASLSEISQVINHALGADIASHDGAFLTLLSQKSASNSQISILPLTSKESTRFVSRTAILGEASDKIFGLNAAVVRGQEASPARVDGTVVLTRGIDLRPAQYLSIKINDNPAVTINCAGPRPRATLLSEVIDNINTALAAPIAQQTDGKLSLIAPIGSSTANTSSNSSIEFITPNVTDARTLLLAVETGLVRGTDAKGVSFVGTKNLSSSVDLTVNANLKLTIDDIGPLQINCAGPTPAATTLAQITIAINIAFGKNVANHDGSHLILTSNKSGTDCLVEILPADQNDATPAILGITIPRTYIGKAASSAMIIGNIDLSTTLVDLSEQHFIEIAIDGNEPLLIDCSSQAANSNQVSLAEIIDAIDTTAGHPVATESSGYLVLSSPSLGFSSRVDLLTHTGSDAKQILFGDIGDEFTGESATTAVLESQLDISTGVDLSERNLLSLRIDQQPAITVEISAVKQDQVFVEEIAEAINAQINDLATVTVNGTLSLQSPSTGSQSRIELLPIRYLQLQEYLPSEVTEQTEFTVQHGSKIVLNNVGAAEVTTNLSIQAENGVFGAGLVNQQLHWCIRLFSLVRPQERISFTPHADYGVEAHIVPLIGPARKIHGSELEIGPLLPHMSVPAQSSWRLSKGLEKVDGITLNNPLAPNILIAKSQLAEDPRSHIEINVKQADLTHPEVISQTEIGNAEWQFIGKLQYLNDQYQLLDKNHTLLCELITSSQVSGKQTKLMDFVDKVVIADGTLLTTPGVLLHQLHVVNLACLFDVTVGLHSTSQGDLQEKYTLVSIGESRVTEHALQQQLIFSDPPSVLLRAVSREKQQILSIPKGRSNWRYIECLNSRFDQTHFDSPSKYEGRFAGGFNIELGLADVSQMHNQPPAQISALYAATDYTPNHKTQVVFDYAQHQAGSMRVILPTDLPPRFGGRFNQALFSVPTDKPETHTQVVTEPDTDSQYLVTLVNADSKLITAQVVTQVPLGFSALAIPFAKAAPLINGSKSLAARIYLTEPDVPGFIELSAKDVGVWGNQLSVVMCESGPAIFDLLVNFPGSRFENARNLVLGDELTGVVNESLRPGAMGVRQAKAAGIKVEVVRENCVTTVSNNGKPDV